MANTAFFLERCTDAWRRFDYCQWSDEDGSTAIADGLIQMQFVHIPSAAQQQISLYTTAEGRRELDPIHTELSRFTKVCYALRLNYGTKAEEFNRPNVRSFLPFFMRAILAGQAEKRILKSGNSAIDFFFRNPNDAAKLLQNIPIVEPQNPVDERHSSSTT